VRRLGIVYGRWRFRTRLNVILAALQAHPEGMTRTQISAVFAGNLPQDRIEEALDLLRKSESAVEKPVVGSKIPRWFSAENAEDEKHEKN
jgi:predicted transcriptional regulator